MKVTVRNLTIGSGKPKICAVVKGKDKAAVLHCGREAVEADLIEWRADAYSWDNHTDVLRELRNVIGNKPIIYTFRTKNEGGAAISPDKYKSLLLSVAKDGVADIIDVEVFFIKDDAREFINQIKKYDVKIIGSYHDMAKTPDTEELIYRFSVIDSCNADILKIATEPLNKKDVIHTMMASTFICERPDAKPVIAISMGEIGKVTRFIGEFTGSAISFAKIGESNLGQPDIKELKEIFGKLNI